MPYRRVGKCVEVKRDNAWVELKCHATAKEAQAHLVALALNVPAQKSARAEKSLNIPFDEEDEVFKSTYKRVLDETGDAMKAMLAARGAFMRNKRFGLATKSAPQGLLIGGWAIYFADERYLDLQKTFFPAKTQLFLDFYQGAPLWYEHGEHSATGITPIGRRVGHEVHDWGVWLEHELFTDHPMYPTIKAKIERGDLGYSSDTLGHIMAKGYKGSTGELSVWPLAGCSLTPTPAEPALGAVVPLSDESGTIDTE